MSLIQLKTITALYPLTLSALGDFFTTSIQRPLSTCSMTTTRGWYNR
ncbi:hypothetical protein PITC_025270 [Penicillium italicum]|uniref:Uncharacterized protein n=1 Tax=Penicillium italicum TaxID=40296 RepID=A0A0A2LDK3_PENIT|nr:hypothetical protein PITC_025270 [Penicillium italicum]